MNNNQSKVKDAARKIEAIGTDALEKADRLLVKTATLRHQVNKLKDEVAEEVATKEHGKSADQL